MSKWILLNFIVYILPLWQLNRSQSSFCLLQQNHEALISLYRDMEMGVYVPNTVSSSWSDRKKEEKQLIDILIDHFSKSSISYSKSKARKRGAYQMCSLYISQKKALILKRLGQHRLNIWCIGWMMSSPLRCLFYWFVQEMEPFQWLSSWWWRSLRHTHSLW